MNKRSPRVVTRGRKPRRGTQGRRNSQTVIAASKAAMTPKNTAVGRVQAIQFMIDSYTRPSAKPLATWLRTNQITSMPGRMVSTPAAASTPQSMPDAETVRVMTETMGLASTEVRVLASSSSTQENMKQKKAVTPMPEPINGTKIFTKNRGKL